MVDNDRYKEIMDLAMRRGFFFPAAEIYSDTIAGFWDYGPLGTTLKRRIINFWRETIVRKDDMLEIDGSQILPESVFKSSGHLKSFVDPLTECQECKKIFRADKLVHETTNELIPESLSTQDFDRLINKHDIRCPECGNALSKVKKFNMMFRFTAGPKKEAKIALRPETCQSIFLDFARIHRVMRTGLPIGLAQVGRSYRNEISPRKGLIRLRELIQAEIEVFFNPNKLNEFEKLNVLADKKMNFLLLEKRKSITLTAKESVVKGIVQNELIAYYLTLLVNFYECLGIEPNKIRLRELGNNEKPFYAQSAWDLEIETSYGWLETVANHYRTDYDLKVHSKGSGKDLSVMDGEEKVMPWIWEDSMGIDRTVLVVLDAAYTKEGKRVFLKLRNQIAPIQVAVFPLVDRDGLTEKAKSVYEMIKCCFDAVFDEKDSIGRRYYRTDEIGVPYAITIDYDTLKDNTVTIRERDTRQQKRISVNEIEGWLDQKYYRKRCIR